MNGDNLWRSRAFWVAVVLATALLWWHRDTRSDSVPGIVRASRHQLGPVEASRVAAVYVQPGEVVRTGQEIARFDCQEVEAELAVARATLEEGFAEVSAVTAELTTEAQRRRLQVETDLARSSANLAAVKGQQAGREAELALLRADLERLDEALRSRLAQADRLAELRTRQERLAGESVHGPEVVRAWAENTAEIREALEDIAAEDLSIRVQPLRARIETQNRRVEQILVRSGQCTLRSPVEGRVSEIRRFAGDTVAAGEPLAILVGARVGEVTAYADIRAVDSFVSGSVVRVRPQSRGGPAWPGIVERVGPEVVEIPPRLWPVPDRPVYGRPVHVRIEEGSNLVPGELASVTARRGVVEAASPPPNGLLGLEVPAALQSRTRLEPSGAVWLPARERILVVSDDTGFRGAAEHSPWVFTVHSEGGFDPTPITLEGIDQVSDLESITRAPDGTLYLLASQSRSRRGKRPTKRQWLLRVRDDGKQMSVTGRLALYDELLSRLEAPLRKELGISDGLDVEGVAWHEGGLLLGLKSPLDESGRARIWLLPAVDELLDRDESTAPGVPHLFATLALPTCAAGAPGGISDLLLEDQTLYVLSTLPDGPACGSAWVVDLSEEDSVPRKLADWSKLKPEGIARVETGSLFVLFDTGSKAPLFTRLGDT